MNNRAMSVLMGCVAIAVGAVINYAGDRLLGMRLELFWGVSTFSPLWIVDLFVIPFIAGFAVSMVYGLGGKLLCYFAPIIVRGISYFQMSNYPNLPEGVVLLPLGYWVLILIVAIEAAAFGGAFGEIMVKKTYGRRPKHLLYKQPSDSSSEN
jgi:hypothetical protein